MNEKKCVFGMKENTAGVVAYAGVFCTGILFLVMERENKTVRFHALQSTLTFIALGLLSMVAGWIPFIGGLLSWAVGVVTFAAWLYLMYTAHKGIKFKAPVLGDVCEQQVNK